MMIQSYSTPASVSSFFLLNLVVQWYFFKAPDSWAPIIFPSNPIPQNMLVFCFSVSAIIFSTVFMFHSRPFLSLFLCFPIIFPTTCSSSVSAFSPPPFHLWCSDTSVCRSTYSTTSPLRPLSRVEPSVLLLKRSQKLNASTSKQDSMLPFFYSEEWRFFENLKLTCVQAPVLRDVFCIWLLTVKKISWVGRSTTVHLTRNVPGWLLVKSLFNFKISKVDLTRVLFSFFPCFTAMQWDKT